MNNQDTDNIFSTIDDNIEQLEIDNTFGPNTSSNDLTPASLEDKQKAAEAGKADTEQEKAAKALAEKTKKEEEEARKQIDNDFLDPENDLDNPNPSKDKTSAKKENTNEDKDLSYLEELSKDLVDLNIFSRESEDEPLPKTQEEFVAKWQAEKEKGAEELLANFVNKYGDEYAEAFDAIFVDGASPREYLAKFEQIQSFKDMDLTDEDNQVKVVKTALRKQGWEEKDIDDKVKSLKLNSELESDSIRYHKALVRTEEQEAQKMASDAKVKLEQKQAAEEQYKTNLRSIFTSKVKAKDFNGIPVTKESATRALHMLEDKNWKLPDGQLITDWDYAMLELNKPANHEVKAMLGLLIDFKPGQPVKLNLGNVVKSTESKAKQEYFKYSTKGQLTETSKKSPNKESNFFSEH